MLEGQPVITDAGGPVSPGRGAHVCIARACIFSLGNKSLSRAFRESIRDVDAEAFAAQGRALAEKRLLASLGLARRAGVVKVGLDTVLAAAGDGAGSTKSASTSTKFLVVAATDLAPRSERQLAKLQPWRLVDAVTLGSAMGMGRVGVAALPPGRHAQKVGFWARVYRELENREQRQAV